MQPGDVVQMKSGGPLMTIESIDESGVICSWFEKNVRKNDRFAVVTLQKYVDKPVNIGFVVR